MVEEANGEDVECVRCHAELPAAAAFCPQCGAGTARGQAPGPVLPGYTILRTLGHGGFAVVYLARQESLDREVAIKVLRRDVEDPRAWRRFRREAHTVARLSGHPNVVTVYTVSRSTGGQPCLVTEYLDRGSLAGIIATEGGLRLGFVVKVGLAIADALAAAHELGILHRDVKPANVLLGDHDRTKLGDFGIARLLATQSASSTTDVFAFTPEHVAPEVLRGEADGPWSDVYGLASTLAEAIIGTPLFARMPDEGVQGMLSRKIAGPPPPLPASVPRPLADLIARGLLPDPTQRPSLTQFRHGLAAMADGQDEATPLGPAASAMAVTVPTPTLASASRVRSPRRAPRVKPADPPQPSSNRRQRRFRGAPLAVAAVAVALIATMVTLTLRAINDDASPPSLVTQPSAARSIPVPAASAPASAAPPPTTPRSTGLTTVPESALPSNGTEPSVTVTVPPPSSTPASTASPAIAAPTTTAPPTTAGTPAATTLPPTADTSAPAAGPPAGQAVATAQQAEAFLRSYYEAVGTGDYEVSWSQLTPEFQRGRARSYEYYVEFWNDNAVEVDGVRIVSATADELILDADLRWNASTSIVTNRFTLRPGEDGQLLIAGEASVNAS